MRTFVVFKSEEDGGYIAHEENHPNISGFSENKVDALEEAKIAWEMFQIEQNKLADEIEKFNNDETNS